MFDLNLDQNTDPIRLAIRQQYRSDEAEVINALLPIAELDATTKARTWHRARKLVDGIRSAQSGKGGIDELLNEFALSTQEGVVLMCLAEALLRVPDARTADWLIRDKLESGDWSSHLGNSDSMFVNASAWGLLLTGTVVGFNDDDKEEKIGMLKKTVNRLGEPVIRAAVTQAMRIMGGQFVMGQTIEAATERARELEEKGYTYSYDMLGEAARTMADADRYYQTYLDAIHAIGKIANGRGPVLSPGISVKLSAIHPRYEFAQRDRVMTELVPRLKELALAAKEHDIGFTIDAEEADRLDISLDVIEAVFSDPDLNGWEGFGIAVQAYQKRAIHVVDWLVDLTSRVSRKMMVRLVKGAYWDTEIKLAQVDGHEGYPVFGRKPSTDLSYQACARRLLENRDRIYSQFASHNAYTVSAVLEMAGTLEDFEFQRLHGMGDELYDQVMQDAGIPCRIYAPVGQHEDLLAYLVRRLLENGANTSFVNNIVDESVAIESLIEDPVEKVTNWPEIANPHIPLPEDLYGSSRVNSAGLDLTDSLTLLELQSGLNQWTEANVTTVDDKTRLGIVINPTDHNELLGEISLSSETDLEDMLAATSTAFSVWSEKPVADRATCLRNLADALENHRDELMALCTREAGKTLADGIAEVREAVDFCRYYANQAEMLFTEHAVQPRGVILCISPWNFPLAIFLGQVSAALAAGNTVIAKPSEQTRLIAEYAVSLMPDCGFPEDAVHLANCRGSVAGKQLVPDERVAGVMFTGSTETGAIIAKALAQRSGPRAPLIAETGGQNAMIVDSTALPEQVVDDVITSGFQSAGQRCSALRVLFVQEDVADKISEMIVGAMRELKVGNPAKLDTDVGPVIDKAALQTLENHAEYMKTAGKLLYQCDLSNECSNGYFFAPRLYEIENLDVLEREVFGPVVHLIQYRADELDEVIDAVNATGYGLTLGIHSRIGAAADRIARRARVGNVYVNRNMIGAVVGVQPFGGRGLSGTGPKAGGPHYLTRLVSDNTETAHDWASSDENLPRHEDLPKELDSLLSQLLDQQKIWARRSVTERASAIRQFAGIAAVKAAETELKEEEIGELVRHCQQLAAQAEQSLDQPLTMPGPTGERNLLHHESRGTLLCLHAEPFSASHWAIQIAAALLSGNTVLATANPNEAELPQSIIGWFREAGIPADVLAMALVTEGESSALQQDARIHGVAMNHCPKQILASSRLLAQRDGELIPLISEPYSPLYLHRFTTEKTVTVDTTASGGNASLMTLGSSD